MQPIATPDKTIDSTIGSSAVARSQVERAVLERVGLHHHYFSVRITVVLVGREGDVAVDAGETLELVEIAHDLLRIGTNGLYGLAEHIGAVVSDPDPPQQRVGQLNFGALQPV